MNELKERLDQLIEETKQELRNIYLPHDTVLLLSGKRLGLEIAANIIGVLPEQEPEQPMTDCHDLEKEIAEAWEPYDQMGFDLTKSQFADIARHFAEWGAEHLKR